MAKETEDYKREIEEGRLSLEEKYVLAMTAARKTVQSHDKLIAAEETRDFRGGSKDIAKHEIAESLFDAAVKKFFYFLTVYDQAVENCISLYSQLISSACAKEAKKARAEVEKLEERERYRRDKLFDVIRYVNGIDDMYSEYVLESTNTDVSDHLAFENEAAEEPAAQNTPLSEAEPEDLQKKFYQTDSTHNNPHDNEDGAALRDGYNVYAASIDISPIIEEAISVAMAKFNSALDKSVDDAIIQYSQKARPSAMPSDALKMHCELVDFELEIAGKLAELTDKLKGISDQMIQITSACMTLSDAQKSIAESQKKANDAQRDLIREMQEIQEDQRAVSDEQTSLAQEQAAVMEKQKLNFDNQSALAERQSAVAAVHESVLQTQDLIEKSSNEMLEAYKQISSMQQTAVSALNKNLELQRGLTEKQNKLIALQKAAVSDHKQVKRKLKKDLR